MRVLQISNYYFPNYGGIEQVTHDIAQALSERGIDQKVICFNSDAEAGTHVCHKDEDKTEIIDGVEVIRCKCATKIASQSVSFTYPKHLKDVMDSFNPDCIIIQYPNPYAAYFTLRYLNSKAKLIVFWQSDIVKQKFLGKLFSKMEDELAAKADKIVATSPNYIDGSRILNKYRNKCVVLPNCVNESRLIVNDKILARVEEIRNENVGKVICFAIGRHVPYKGFEYLIRASRLLDDRFQIFIAGSGPLTKKLEEEASRDNKIHFIGKLQNDELFARYISSDIFCFPSITKNEAFGVVLAEAMYFGKPAVTFHIPGSGVNYVSLADKSGLECPNRDVGAYAKAMTSLADNPEYRKRLGEGAHDRAIRLFLYKQFKENIYDLLDI